jgi:hypothetical protein
VCAVSSRHPWFPKVVNLGFVPLRAPCYVCVEETVIFVITIIIFPPFHFHSFFICLTGDVLLGD